MFIEDIFEMLLHCMSDTLLLSGCSKSILTLEFHWYNSSSARLKDKVKIRI